MTNDKIIELLNNSYAHKKYINKKTIINETLMEHSIRSFYSAKFYFENIINEEYFKSLVENVFKYISYNDFKSYVLMGAYFHDFGKINPNFQKIKMDNQNVIKMLFPIDKNNTNHSEFISLLSTNPIKLLLNFKTIAEDNRFKLNLNNFDCHNISTLIETDTNVKIEFQLLSNIIKTCIKEHHTNFNIECINTDNVNSEQILILSEMIYEIIVASDNFATGYFMDIVKHTSNIDDEEQLLNYIKNEIELSTISNELSMNLQENFINNEIYSYNKNIVNAKNVNVSIIDYVNDLEKKLTDYNNQQLLKEFKTFVATKFYQSNIFSEENNDDKLKNFYLFKGTTGIGKTNLSYLYIYKLLQSNSIKNIKMVFPLTSLMKQYKDDFEATFQIDKINLDTYKNGLIMCTNEVNNLLYSDEDENVEYKYLQYEKLNHKAPIVITSHVSFFDKLFMKNRLSYAYLHTLKNSCIILDEIQLYNDCTYQLVYKYLDYFSKIYDFKVLIISATLPLAATNEQKQIYNEINLSNRFILSNDEMNTINNCSIFKRSVIVNKVLNNNLNDENFTQYKPYFETNSGLFRQENELDLIQMVLKQYVTKFEEKKQKFIGMITFNTIKKSKKIELEIRNYIEDKNLQDTIEIVNFNNSILEPVLTNLTKKIRTGTFDKHLLILATQKIDTGIDISVNFSIRYYTYIDNLFQNIGRLNRYMTYSKDDSLFFIIRDKNEFQPIFIGDGSLKSALFKSNKNTLKHFFENNIDEYYKEVFNTKNETKEKIPIIEFSVKEINNISNARMINNQYKPNKILINLSLYKIKHYFGNKESIYFDETIYKYIKSLESFSIDFNQKIKDLLNNIYIYSLVEQELIKIIGKKVTINTTIPKNIILSKFEDNNYFEYCIEFEQITSNIDVDFSFNNNPIYSLENGFIFNDEENGVI